VDRRNTAHINELGGNLSDIFEAIKSSNLTALNVRLADWAVEPITPGHTADASGHPAGPYDI